MTLRYPLAGQNMICGAMIARRAPLSTIGIMTANESNSTTYIKIYKALVIVYSDINEWHVKPTTDEKFWKVVNIIPIPPSKTMRW